MDTVYKSESPGAHKMPAQLIEATGGVVDGGTFEMRRDRPHSGTVMTGDVEPGGSFSLHVATWEDRHKSRDSELLVRISYAWNGEFQGAINKHSEAVGEALALEIIRDIVNVSCFMMIQHHEVVEQAA